MTDLAKFSFSFEYKNEQLIEQPELLHVGYRFLINKLATACMENKVSVNRFHLDKKPSLEKGFTNVTLTARNVEDK